MKIADIEKNINLLAHSLSGKIEQWRIDFAMEYIGHGESKLAFETLCEYICEANADISLEDFEVILAISYSGYELHPLLLIYLAKLVGDVPNSPPAP
ncbi:MafI family immunity protein (plasmid) [Rhizobium sp. CB3171]|uniref:MafI family immunity protein n=1 Tax=Rhizobium sp. CB3171 TaxID=3039157 RepID=UPI0024B11CD3|nr:MafI family immunity protein [Rhizobium sp. CB3171]WFU07176.1 MafI family immunity protein [Rhizobium sp. CB3171]